jgi:hydrogenase maturation factor
LVVVVEQAPTEQTQALLELVCLLQQSVVVVVVGQVQVAAQAAVVVHLGLVMAVGRERQAKAMLVVLT